MGDSVKVLVIDDEDNVLLSVKKAITSKHPDYVIETVNEPAAGLQRIEGGTYDLVITDLMMPGMDGLELIRRIRAMAPDLKVVMITGYATMKTALLAMREGASKYVSKPFTRDELLGAIHEALELPDTPDTPE